jgi:hypothetical protein
MLTTRITVVAALAASLFAVGCDKSLSVEAVSVSDATGKTIALDDDPTAVFIAEDKLEVPVEIAFRATGEAITTGRSLDLDSFNMAPKDSPNCAVTKLGSCSGEVCTVIVRWNEPGFCAFRTRIRDAMGDEVASCRGMYVGIDKAAEARAAEAFEGGLTAERRRRCWGEESGER